VTFRYHAHGLRVDSDIALPLPPADPNDARGNDLVLRRRPDRPVPTTDPSGDPIARVCDRNGTPFYSITGDDAGTRLRYPGMCEFAGGPGLRDVGVTLAPGRDPGVIPVLASGMLLALHLRLRGELVLHASAVGVGKAALAFVGASGMGKSTMATVMCGAGYPLLTDDVLRVQLRPDEVVVHTGSTETRLREAAQPLADGLASRRTADGRLAVAPGSFVGPPIPLAACVVPQPSRECDRVRIRRLSGARALLLLSRFPRIPGWVQPTALAREFEQLADLVTRVVVYEARIPWGPPFAPDLPADLLVRLGLDAVQR
jgi:hypothetical protein